MYKDIKKEAKKSLKRNFFKTILIVFMASTIINGGYNYTTYIFEKINVKNALVYSVDDLKTSFVNIAGININKRGILAPLVNNIYEYDSITVGSLKTINNMVLKDKFSNHFINTVAFIITLLFFIFVQNIVKVGEVRYFLEQRRYKNTKIDKLLYVYNKKKTIYVANTMFKRFIYQILWTLTIIMGPVKYYEYKLIPYILAYDPTLETEKVFTLSKELSDGHKFDMFKLDLSLIGYYILHILTLGLSTLFYFGAYKESLYAEVFMKLKGNTLKDKDLDIEEYEYRALNEEKGPLDANYRKKYSVTTYILLFFTCSMIGWIWEVALEFVKSNTFVNRGSMAGPWLPIYGYGAVLILILLKPLRKNHVVFFIAAMILAGIMEYTTSWYLETINGMRWWEYDGYFLNINGRVCLEGLLVFGFAGAAVTYYVGPVLNNIFSKIPKKIAIILSIVLIFAYGVDLGYSHMYPNKGTGITYELSNS